MGGSGFLAWLFVFLAAVFFFLVWFWVLEGGEEGGGEVSCLWREGGGLWEVGCWGVWCGVMMVKDMGSLFGGFWGSRGTGRDARLVLGRCGKVF